jgi:hypothetical protein
MSQRELFQLRKPLGSDTKIQHNGIRESLAALNRFEAEAGGRGRCPDTPQANQLSQELRANMADALTVLRSIRDELCDASEGLMSALELLNRSDNHSLNAGRLFYLLQPFVRQIETADSHLSDLLDFTEGV